MIPSFHGSLLFVHTAYTAVEETNIAHFGHLSECHYINIIIVIPDVLTRPQPLPFPHSPYSCIETFPTCNTATLTEGRRG